MDEKKKRWVRLVYDFWTPAPLPPPINFVHDHFYFLENRFLGNYQKDKLDALTGKFSSFLIIFRFYPKIQQLKPLKP